MNDICFGIDIGSDRIKLVVSNRQKGGGVPQILDNKSFFSRGFQAGIIVDEREAEKSLENVFRYIKERYQKGSFSNFSMALGGRLVFSKIAKSKIAIDGDGEINDRHIRRVLRDAKAKFLEDYPNDEILHSIPIHYFVDEEEIDGNPIGMFGEVLKVKILFLSYKKQAVDQIISLFESSGFEIDSFSASPIAESQAVLRYRQKMQGVVLINIGAETTSISLFQHGVLQSFRVYSIGSNHITNDIALAFQIPLEEAEKVKVGSDDTYSKRKVQEIISARLEDIVELVRRELKEGRKMRYLPAGIVLTGGASLHSLVSSFLREKLGFPVEVARISKKPFSAKRSAMIDGTYASAYGVCFHEANVPQRKKSSFRFYHFFKSLPSLIFNFFENIKP